MYSMYVIIKDNARVKQKKNTSFQFYTIKNYLNKSFLRVVLYLCAKCLLRNLTDSACTYHFMILLTIYSRPTQIYTKPIQE